MRAKHHWEALTLTGWILAVLPWAQAESRERPGEVQFSDGETIEGVISLTPGAELTVDTGHGLRRISLEKVQSINLTPEHEELVQKWKFIEAGKTQKQVDGEPYPVRQLRATVRVAGSETIAGHLYTTVLYVDGKDKAQKVVLWAKQRGKEGQALAALVYPSRVLFRDAAEPESGGVSVVLDSGSEHGPTEVVGVTRGSLVRLEAVSRPDSNTVRLPSGLGADLFLARKRGSAITVHWPQQAPELFTNLVRTNLALTEDFFDHRDLLAVFYDAPQQDVYSLLMLSRQGETTLATKTNRPWRLVILRWKYEPEGQRLLLAGRGYFYRGVLAEGEPLPSVRLESRPGQSGNQGKIKME